MPGVDLELEPPIPSTVPGSKRRPVQEGWEAQIYSACFYRPNGIDEKVDQTYLLVCSVNLPALKGRAVSRLV